MAHFHRWFQNTDFFIRIFQFHVKKKTCIWGVNEQKCVMERGDYEDFEEWNVEYDGGLTSS